MTLKLSLRAATICVALLLTGVQASAQDIVVTGADPGSAEQGTVNLDVRISGKGFKRGAITRFYRTGTTDPDGIVVNGTTYVSASEVVANISVTSTASLSNFDIEVMASGRTGKGTEMFTVTAPIAGAGAGATCTLPQSDPAFTLVGTLNTTVGNTPLFTGGFGISSAMRRATLPAGATPGNVLIAAVGSYQSNQIDIFVLDSATGVSQQTFSVVPDPALVLDIRSLDAGEINGDGLPDFAVGDPFQNAVFVLLSHTTAGGLGYTAVRVPRPAGTGAFGGAVALGDLDGDQRDELAVTVGVAGTGKKATTGAVSLYAFPLPLLQPSYLRQLALPGPDQVNPVGVEIAELDGMPGTDVIVGAPRKADRGTDAGAVYVFSGGTTASITPLYAAGPQASDTFGRKVQAADVDGDTALDLIVSTGWQGPDIRADVVRGTLSGITSASVPDATLAMRPPAGLGDGWSTSNPSAADINEDGFADVVVGAPNATVGRCTSPGAAYVFLHSGTAAPVRHVLWAPAPDPDFAAFGWSVSSVAGSPVILVTEHGRDVGGVRNAGQVYIYRYSPQ